MSSRSKLFVLTTSTCLVVILLLGAVKAKSAPPTDDPYRHLAVFSEVLSRIKSEYVEEPDIKNVSLGAMNGLLESIDPYASYLNADQYKQYMKNRAEGSVGLVLSKKLGSINVVDVIPGGAAAKAGLNTYDMIEGINGVGTRDMPLAYAEFLLSGEPGSTVEVSVLGVTKPDPHKITLTRSIIKYPEISSKMLPDQIGYVRVTTLESRKVKEVAAAIEKLSHEGAKKLVLDLRSDAFGTPDEGIALANLFLDKGLIAYLQGQKVPRQNFEAAPVKAIWKSPMIVITNRGTADGAEVAAAALLDSKRSEVVGERTYGDASLRKPITMEDGGAIILSVAKYYSPSGKAIQDNGVTPTYAVTENEQSAEVDEDGNPVGTDENPGNKKPQEDVLLKKAIDVLSGKSVQAAAPAGSVTADSGSSERPAILPKSK